MNTTTLFPTLQNYLSDLASEFAQISPERRAILAPLSAYIRTRREKQVPIELIVICTHNSRRSHLGQLWLQVAAQCYGIEQVQTYSGGTEATAFHPNTVEAARTVGFEIEATSTMENPVYAVRFGSEQGTQQAFSKRYDHEVNPSTDFGAILVCTSADEACPTVFGADGRFPIPFTDPKALDGTGQQTAAYLACARQIAREFFWVMQAATDESV